MSESESEEYRDLAREQLRACFGKKHAPAIEDHAWRYSHEYCAGNGLDGNLAYSIYQDKVGDLVYNFSLDNADIRRHKRHLANGKMDPAKIPYLSPQELQPKVWAKSIARMLLTEQKRNDAPAVTLKPCKVCECTQHYCYQMQLRSADEAMTQFQKCAECDNVVRLSD